MPPTAAAATPIPTAPPTKCRRSTPIGWAIGGPSPATVVDGAGAGRVRNQITATETAVPRIVGSSLASVGAGRCSTAAAPIAPMATVSAYAAGRRPRTASTPTMTPTTPITISAPRTSTTLSLVPNVSIAQFFSDRGTQSMNC